MSAKLTLHGINVHHPSGQDRARNPEAVSTAELVLFTPGGQSRSVELSKRQLLQLAADAIVAAARLDGHPLRR